MNYPLYRVYTGENFEIKKRYDFKDLRSLIEWAKHKNIDTFRFYMVDGIGTLQGKAYLLPMQDIMDYAEEEYDRGAEANTGYGIY